MDISRLHFISQDNGDGHVFGIRQALDAGAKWIQLRMKDYDADDIRTTGLIVREMTAQYDAVFILNDYVEIANEIEADGVHLGRDDMSVMRARAILGPDKIIGATVNNAIQMQRRLLEDIDYFGIGPYRYTESKEGLSPVLGPEGIKALLDNYPSSVPAIAIGGISLEDIADVMQTGAFGIAMAAQLNDGNNLKKKIFRISELISINNNDNAEIAHS